MISRNITSISNIIVVLTALAPSAMVVLAEMTPLDPPPSFSQSASGISIPALCNANGQTFPNTMYTVEPTPDDGTDIIISSDPPNLVSVTETDGVLSFSFNKDVATTAGSGGGVLIQFPAGQLSSVAASVSGQVQVKEGFANLSVLGADTSASLSAVVNNKTGNLVLNAATSGYVRVDLSDLSVDVTVKASTSGIVDVNGNVTSAQVQTSGRVNLDGSITNLEESSHSTSGTITTTGSCDGIQSDITGGQCSSQSEVVVDVSVERPLTRDGTFTCRNNSSDAASHRAATMMWWITIVLGTGKMLFVV